MAPPFPASPASLPGAADDDDPHERAEALLRESRDGDPCRRERLEQEAVLLTMDIADAVASRYRNRGIDAEDLAQVARLALVKAARGYEPGHGRGFPAYAVPTVTGEVKRYFRDRGWAVRPPRRLQELRADLGTEEERLRQSLGREPTDAEVAEPLGVAVDEVRAARACQGAYTAVSLDAPTALAGQIGPRAGIDPYASLDLRDALARALARLTSRERTIVRLRFVEERTQSEIGRSLGVSQMQVSRLLATILGRLRLALTDAEDAA